MLLYVAPMLAPAFCSTLFCTIQILLALESSIFSLLSMHEQCLTLVETEWWHLRHSLAQVLERAVWAHSLLLMEMSCHHIQMGMMFSTTTRPWCVLASTAAILKWMSCIRLFSITSRWSLLVPSSTGFYKTIISCSSQKMTCSPAKMNLQMCQ